MANDALSRRFQDSNVPRPDTLYAVSFDRTPFALVKAIDETDAVDLAIGLFAADWFSIRADNDHFSAAPLLAASKHRHRLTAHPPTENERHLFAQRAEEVAEQDVALAAFVVAY